MTTHINLDYHTWKFKKSFKRNVTALFSSMLLLSALANAQEKALTLEEAVTLGLNNSKTLKLSQSKIDQAVSQYNQAKDKTLPTGSISYNYSFAYIPANRLSFEGIKIALPKTAESSIGTASVSEIIYAGKKLKYAKESTELLTRVALLDAELDKDQIAFDITNEYYNLYKVLQSQKVVQQNLKSIDEQIRQAQRFFEQGLVTKNDVLRFQLQRSNIELNGVDLETNRKVVNYNLNILLGLPEATQLIINHIIDIDQSIAPFDSYLDTALANRQELLGLDIRARASDLNVKSIRASQLPTLAAAVNGYLLGVTANPIPQNGDYLAPLTAGLNVSWNFGSLWTTKNKIAEAKIASDQVVINKNITTDRIKNEVNQSYQNYVTAIQRVKLLQTSIEQATENSKITASKYANGTASAIDRVDAETLLYQAQTDLELAKASVGLTYYSLFKSTGKRIKQ